MSARDDDASKAAAVAAAVAAAAWTPEKANRALPLVRRIADDVVQQYAVWQELVARFEVVALKSRADRPDHEADLLAREVQRAAKEIQGFVSELTELGVECKSLELGLMDFAGERDGRTVYFCWQRGESSVEHWHELDAGFAGRQSL